MKKYFEQPLTDQEFQNLEPQQRDENKLENVGLAISGGGIRSATFALGVIHSLAKAKRLKDISYLCTVSGGGDIGTWLILWIQREADGPKEFWESILVFPSTNRETHGLGVGI